MRVTRIFRSVLALVVATALTSVAQADVFSGTVVSINPTSGRLVVKARSKATNRSFRLAKSVRITIDGKKAYISKVKPGQTVSVFYSGSNASRLIVRRRKESPKPVVDPVKPKTSTTGPKTTTTTNRPPRTRPSQTTRTPNRNTAESGGEWNQFRGPNRDNKSTETGLLQSWPSDGPRLAWTARGFGEGYSSVAIADGKVVSMGNIQGAEHVVAVDLKNGNPAWTTRISDGYRDNTGNGPRGTPSIVDGKV